MTATAHAFVPILTKARQDDGTLLVTGVATDSSLDRDQQVCDPGWLQKAMPRWFSESGNIREQHDPHKAAGVAVELAENDQGQHVISAKIVDPVTVAKVESGVLKGFSFGARNARVTVDKAAAGGRIVAGDIYEVSVVDRPANPNAVLTIAKADGAGALQLVDAPELVEKTIQVGDAAFTPADLAALLDKRAGKPAPAPVVKADVNDAGEAPMPMFGDQLAKAVSADQRKAYAKSGIAMPNGDFPIPDEGHLRSAVGHLGNYTGNKAAAKKHIIKRARALKLTNLLPDDWGISKADALIAEYGLIAELDKADDDGALEAVTEVGDIAGAKQAIACIARLIVSEATDLAAGDLDEIRDISTLVEAACALKWFICSEAEQVGERMAPPVAVDVDVTVTAASAEDMLTAAGKTDAPAPTTTDGPTGYVIEKTDTANTDSTTDLATITKALTVQEAALAALRAELAEVKATPVPGGPVRTRKTDHADERRHTLTARLGRFQQLADTTTGGMSKGYREMADDVRGELAKLDG